MPADFEPLVEELCPAPDVEAAFQRVCRRPGCAFLDSALREPRLGRYSFLTCDPYEFVVGQEPVGDVLRRLGERLSRFRAPRQRGLPPFQGGAVGVFGYELGRSLERIPAPRFDEFRAPVLAVGLYDTVLSFDHETRRAWLISQGFPAQEPAARRRRAAERLQQFRRLLRAPPAAQIVRPFDGVVPRQELAPQHPVTRELNVTSNFSADGYRRAVSRAVDYIHAGDVFQVNLAQRLLAPARDAPEDLYLRLRRRNPAPFAGYLDLGRFQVVSASPERFLQVLDGRVEARPIKGTRLRTALPEADLYAADDLRQSEKDRAENVMIVDLLRNDLSRVCRPDSVCVTQLCEIEAYQYVQHLVSAVCGELAPECTPLDLLRAAFPGGSITGAPKVRAMEIIAELEPTARGPYCGSLGYLGFDGTMDLSVLIRTITAGRGWWQLPVGGGIVAQSDPEREYQETWHKATGLLHSLR